MVDLELDELKREFLAEADEKVREIESKLADRPPESVQRLSDLAHQLKGPGGSHGFPRNPTVAWSGPAEVRNGVVSMRERIFSANVRASFSSVSGIITANSSPP